MSSHIPPELLSALRVVQERHVEAVVALMGRWPQYRHDLAYAFLGAACALCDELGCDIEGFLGEVRRRHPKPDVLVPPKAVQS